MKTTKKLLAVLLAGVMALCILAGCSGGESISTATIAKKMTSLFKAQKREIVFEEDTRITAVLKEYIQNTNGTVNKDDLFEKGAVKSDVKTAFIEALTEKGIDLKNTDGSNKDVYFAVALTDGYDLLEQTFMLYNEKKPVQETNRKWEGAATIGTVTGKWADSDEIMNVRFAIMVFDTVPRS